MEKPTVTKNEFKLLLIVLGWKPYESYGIHTYLKGEINIRVLADKVWVMKKGKILASVPVKNGDFSKATRYILNRT